VKFKQKEDGSCELLFAEQEIEIIQKHKRLVFTAEFFKHFSNTIVKMAIGFEQNFNEKTKKLESHDDMEIRTDAPKE
tara:strand:+ start:264 stop:494 length:231 start_codon:yes stop_codon:yes gene_type:complete